jgi:hypothetical protein
MQPSQSLKLWAKDYEITFNRKRTILTYLLAIHQLDDYDRVKGKLPRLLSYGIFFNFYSLLNDYGFL